MSTGFVHRALRVARGYSVGRMRWQELFADLEAQARSLERLEQEAEVAERTRGELAQLTLLRRLHAQLGGELSLWVDGVGAVAGRLDRVGSNWLLLSNLDEVLVPTAALMKLMDLPLQATSPDGIGKVTPRLPLGFVLRAVATDRSVVTVRLRDGATLVGTPHRVGADFLDLAVHDPAEPPRRDLVRGRVTVPFEALAVVVRRRVGWD